MVVVGRSQRLKTRKMRKYRLLEVEGDDMAMASDMACHVIKLNGTN